MPSKKNKQPPSKPKCTLSSWRLLDELETVPLEDLCPGLRVPSSKQVNEPDPSECGSCGCDEDVSAPVTCCALDPQREESSSSCPAQELKIPTYVSNSQAIEVEAMIDEIQICREMIRNLALEAMNILHPEQCKQNLQAQQGRIASAKVSCCELHDDSDASPKQNKTKCEISEPRKYSGSEGQSKTGLFPISPTLSKSPALSRKSSGPIAQTACQIKDRRLGQKEAGNKSSNYSCCGEKKQNIDCSCDETMNKRTLGEKPSNCGCDGGKKKNASCPCDEKPESKTDCKTFILKTFGSKPSNCSCNGEKKQKADCKCDNKKESKKDCKTLILEKFGVKPSNCCGEKRQTIGCSCDETMNKNTLGNKPSNCGCDDGEKKQNINCRCDDTMMKQNKENEKRENKTVSSCLEKTFGCMSSDTAPVVIDDCVCADEEMKKRNRANCLKEKYKAASVAAVCATPKCAANTCTCHFPPAYSQYFDCTGHVSGNCHCDKNA